MLRPASRARPGSRPRTARARSALRRSASAASDPGVGARRSMWERCSRRRRSVRRARGAYSESRASLRGSAAAPGHAPLPHPKRAKPTTQSATNARAALSCFTKRHAARFAKGPARSGNHTRALARLGHARERRKVEHLRTHVILRAATHAITASAAAKALASALELDASFTGVAVDARITRRTQVTRIPTWARARGALRGVREPHDRIDRIIAARARASQSAGGEQDQRRAAGGGHEQHPWIIAAKSQRNALFPGFLSRKRGPVTLQSRGPL